jgi:hypothetical protein
VMFIMLSSGKIKLVPQRIATHWFSAFRRKNSNHSHSPKIIDISSRGMTGCIHTLFYAGKLPTKNAASYCKSFHSLSLCSPCLTRFKNTECRRLRNLLIGTSGHSSIPYSQAFYWHIVRFFLSGSSGRKEYCFGLLSLQIPAAESL